MKQKQLLKYILILSIFLGVQSSLSAQVYDNIAVFSGKNTAPTHGIKIKTNIPFKMDIFPSIYIQGYSYGNIKNIDLQLMWYVYNDRFHFARVATKGSGIPPIYIGREDMTDTNPGVVVIYIDNKIGYQRLKISALDTNASTSFYSGWTISDSQINESSFGNKKVLMTYENNFGGKVGIGTDSPQSLLDVRGKIIADEVEIKVNKGADFVFDPTYNLKPLSEVEAFLLENKHLPEIQSEKDMQTNGLNVNEFQIKLLQKIEELTLYVIEQNKKQLLQEELIKELQEKANRK